VSAIVSAVPDDDVHQHHERCRHHPDDMSMTAPKAETRSGGQEMDHETKLGEIFFPYAFERRRIAEENNTRFVHYSSADAAMKMITNREVWMRKASCMNDFSEIEYGMWCLRASFPTAEGKRLLEVLERLFPGLFREVAQIFDSWLPWILENTYLTCLSEHRPDEDMFGRLSMWRAYGGGTGVAVVTTATPFLTESHALRAYASPVGYFTQPQFHQKFVDMVNRIEANEPFLQGIDREKVKIRLFNMFLFAATCTKHPAFKEELEWRVIHHPDLYPSSPHLTKSIETIRGVPQPVYKIRLHNIPAEIHTERLDGVEIPELVDRVIIGPTQHPGVIREAFIIALTRAGVPPDDAERRVVISDIPLRQ
jgi:hypothetical protein